MDIYPKSDMIYCQHMCASDSSSACSRKIHPRAHDGILLFNRGEFFEAHEALEDAWRYEQTEIRDLYKGILQIAVTYLHIQRGNYNGAIKVFHRSQKWLGKWPDVCQGVDVQHMQSDARLVMDEVQRLGKAGLAEFDVSLFKPIKYKP